MHFIFSAVLAIFIQTLAPPPSAIQRVDIVAGTTPISVAAGATTTLWIDVTPKANIHVYAPDAKGFDPPRLIVSPKSGFTIGKATYPAGQPLLAPGTTERVPVYVKTFRITQPLTLPSTMKSGEKVALNGALNYQACDDKLCYPTASVPVSWVVTIR